jgi:hypothetical protein
MQVIYHCLLQENRKSMIELQTSVKQDDTTRQGRTETGGVGGVTPPRFF